MKTKGVSIIICCYNSSDRLSKTLEHIASQKVTNNILWEVIIVNNASTDNTREVAAFEWKKYERDIPFKILDQPVPGLIAAREKGINHACYEYLLFCDDDNWLCEDYVQTAFNIMSSNPDIGVLGGQSEAVCEVARPNWFDNHKGAYAVGKQSQNTGDITHKEGKVFGAGMIVSATALSVLYTANFKSRLSGRKGGSLSSAEDVELCYALRMAGYRIWYDERLYFQHYISEDRLQWKYLVKLEEAFGRSAIITQLYLKVLKNTQSQEEFSRTLWLKKMTKVLRHLLSVSLKNGIMPFSSYSLNKENKELLTYYYFKGQLLEIFNQRSNYSGLLKSIYNLRDQLVGKKSLPLVQK